MNEIQFGIRLNGDAKGLVGSVTASREQFRQLAVDAQKAGAATAGGFTGAARGVRSISEQLDQARTAAAGYFTVSAAIAGTRWMVEQDSAIRGVEARLRAATASADAFRLAQSGVFEMANRYGQAVTDTAGTFARLNPAVEQLGGNVSVSLRMMDALAAATRISGATSAESGALMLQFSQAMGSGVVQGDEFRSMMETAAPLMREVAASLGKTTGELRQMSSEGKLTSEVFGNAVLQSVGRLQERAAAIPATFEQALQAIRNSAARLAHAFMEGISDGQSQSAIGDAIVRSMSEALPNARALGQTLREVTGTAVELAGALVAVRAAATFGPMIEAAARATASTAQLTAAVRAGQAVDLQSAEAVRQRAAASMAAARAAEALTAGELAHLQISRDALLAERALAQVRLQAANQQLAAATAAGALGSAYRLVDDAVKAKSASLLHLADVSRAVAVVERDLAAAQGVAAAASSTAAAATRNYEAAAVATTLAGRAKAGAISLASAAVAGLGGPVGVAIIALTGLAYWLHSSAGAAGELEGALERARAARDRLGKEQKFGTGDAGAQREAIAGLQKQIADEQALLDSNALSSFAERRVRARVDAATAELAQAKAALDTFEKQTAAPAAEVPKLSDAGAFDVLAKPYQWREKLDIAYRENREKLELAALAKLNAAKTDAERAQAEAAYRGVSGALDREYRDAIKGLPDEKAYETLLKGRADNYLRVLDETQRAEVAILQRSLAAGAMSWTDYETARRSLSAALINERVGTVRNSAQSDPVSQAQAAVQIAQIRQQAAEVERELQREAEAVKARRADMLRAIGAEGMGESGSALEKAGADFSRRFTQAAIVAAKNDDAEMGAALEALWGRIAGRAQFADVKARFEALQAELSAGVEKLRTSSEGRGLDAMLKADAAEQSLRARLLPALADTQAQMMALAGSAPDLVKASEEAAKALQQAQAETRRLDERADWTVGLRRGMEAYGRQAMDVASQVESAFTGATRSMEDAFVKFTQTGKFSFSDLANSVLTDILRMQVRAAASGIMSAIGSALGLSGFGSASAQYSLSSGTNLDSMGGGQDLLGAGFGGGRASGGAVGAGTLYEVNERGPELLTTGGRTFLMMGSDGGAVIPAAAAAGGGAATAAQTLRVEIHNDGTPQAVTEAVPRFDAEGMVVQIFTRDLQRNGPMAQALGAFRSRR